MREYLLNHPLLKSIAAVALLILSIASPAEAALTRRENPVSDASYGAGWDTDTTHAPSQNAVYDAGFLTAEVDGSTTNEIQDLSFTGDTLSLSGDVSTVDLSGYYNSLTDLQGAVTNDFHNLGGTDATDDTVSGTELDGVFSSTGLLKRTGAATYTVDANTYTNVTGTPSTTYLAYFFDADTLAGSASAYLSGGALINPIMQVGAAGTSGTFRLYSEQGATDYTASLFANTAMTSAASFYLPADEPAGTYLLNMTTGGVMGFDASTYLTANQSITLSGDVSGTGTTAITTAVADDSHDHTTTTVSGLDISADTNLAVSGTLLGLTDDTLAVKEGTLTNGKGCKFVTGTGIVCDQDYATGSGDVEAVGDCTGGACFDGTSGTTLTFNNAGGDATVDYDGADFSFSKSIETSGDVTVTGSDLTVGAAGVKITGDGDGAITLLGLGDGSDENLTINLDDTSNVIGVSSSTGVTQVNFGAISLLGGLIQSGADGADGQMKIYSEQGGTDYTVTINPHATMTQDTTYTLPANDGDASQYLQTNGSGALSWASVFSDPMTTRGDMLYRNSGNVTARLPVGAANTVLKSDGTDAAWGSPATATQLLYNASTAVGGDAGLTYAYSSTKILTAGSGLTTNAGGSLAIAQSVEAAPGAPTVALAGAGAGNLSNGAYKYRIVFYNGTGDTAGGTASATVTVTDNTTDGQVALSAIPTCTAANITGRRIFRTAAGGTVYYLLASIANNTATTYTDNIADATIITARQVPTLSNFDGWVGYGGTYGFNARSPQFHGLMVNNYRTGGNNDAMFGNYIAYNSNYTGGQNSLFGTTIGNGAITSASYNSVFGYSQAPAITTGTGNTLLGYNSATTLTTGSYNIMLGTNGGGIIGGQYNILIGATNFNTASMADNSTGTMVLGTSSTWATGAYPGSAATAALAAAGAGNVDNGLHRYKVSYTFSNTRTGEGPVGNNYVAATVVDKTSDGQVSMSSIPTYSGALTCTNRKVYRTKAGTTFPYYLLTTIADNTTTTYTDNTADASLGAQQADPLRTLSFGAQTRPAFTRHVTFGGTAGGEGNIQDIYFNGILDSGGVEVAIHGGNRVGTNQAAGDLLLVGGQGTGTGNGGDIEFQIAPPGSSGATFNAPSTKLLIDGRNGYVGIGQTTPTTPLEVMVADNGTAATVKINAVQASVTASDTFIDFRSTSGSEGTIQGTAVAGVIAYNTFTGSHYTIVRPADRSELKPGVLLEAVDGKILAGDLPPVVVEEDIEHDAEVPEVDSLGNIIMEDMIDQNTGLPDPTRKREKMKKIKVTSKIQKTYKASTGKDQLFKSRICSTRRSKAAIGVYGGTDKEGRDMILSIGTGFGIIKNTGQNIEIGDYLMSSSASGKMELQVDANGAKEDLYKNYTVAKATESVVWQDGENSRKISVIYEGG